MSENVILWLFGVLITLQMAIVGALAGAIWTHVKECREVRAIIASIQANLTHLSKEVGDHETGIRGSLHKFKSEMSPFVVWAQRQIEMERRIEREHHR